jgi:hypothetical protein
MPTGAVKKIDGETNEEVATMFLGLFPVGKQWKPKPNKAEIRKEKQQDKLQKPGYVILWASLCAAALCFAITLISQGPIQKKTGTAAIVCGLVSAGAVAYIVAIAHLWWSLLLVAIAGGAMYAYRNKGILFKRD